jgi:DNA sulfur modification protein DndC
MLIGEEFIEDNQQRIALVINVSGGKDSTRMLGFIRFRFPQIPTYCVMADTGFEHVRPVPALEWSRQIAERFGMELHVVRNPNKTYLEMVRARGKFPSAQFRQCTSDLKRGPIQKFIRQLPHPVVINCMGMRAQESAQRARQQPWSKDESLSKAGRIVYNWLPIFSETTEQVLQWHWKHKLPLHPVYVPEYHRDGTVGGYLRRFSCRVCIFASDHDIRMIHEHDREAFDLVSELEEQSGFTMKSGRSLIQIVGTKHPASVEPNQLALFGSAGEEYCSSVVG